MKYSEARRSIRMSLISKDYFDWMYKLVYGDKKYNSLSYYKLLYALHDTEFTFLISKDANRASDGIDLRYQFGYECGYSDDYIAKNLDISPCSVLEMMIALSINGEQHIMDDPKYGDRTGQWFWNMIVSLGLSNMDDRNFDDLYFRKVMQRFLNREYERNGKGGLFTIHDNSLDMRSAEIWYQFMWYLDELFLEE